MNKSKSVSPSVYVIKHENDYGIYPYYSKHGYFHGENDVVSYTDKKHARVFNTEEEANKFILEELPEWAKDKHIAEEFKGVELLIFRPDLYHGLRNQ
jgi:hypothetical protein